MEIYLYALSGLITLDQLRQDATEILAVFGFVLFSRYFPRKWT